MAFDFFLEAYGAKYDKATACLAKDRAGLLTFYDFPAEHWKHLRTTNPIESTFATVRLRTIKTKGCLSRTTAPPWSSSCASRQPRNGGVSTDLTASPRSSRASNSKTEKS